MIEKMAERCWKDEQEIKNILSHSIDKNKKEFINIQLKILSW